MLGTFVRLRPCPPARMLDSVSPRLTMQGADWHHFVPTKVWLDKRSGNVSMCDQSCSSSDTDKLRAAIQFTMTAAHSSGVASDVFTTRS